MHYIIYFILLSIVLLMETIGEMNESNAGASLQMEPVSWYYFLRRVYCVVCYDFIDFEVIVSLTDSLLQICKACLHLTSHR